MQKHSVLFIFAFFCSCAAARPFAAGMLECQFSLGTAAVFYNNTAQNIRSEYFTGKNATRVIFTADTGIVFIPEKHIRIVSGIATLYDFKFGDGAYAHYIDYAFYGGIRIYPGLRGFNFGIDYLLGRRTDFLGGGQYDSKRHTQWGNGFRISAGYDFRTGEKGIAPALGISWQQIPRGTGRDNYLSLFLTLSYR